MIVGMGTDIIELARIEATRSRLGDAFAKRILDENEFAIYRDSKQSLNYLAKRFAIKEAAAKALGTGIGRGVSWQHMHTSHSEYGAPCLAFTGGAHERFVTLGATHCHLSVSDEQHYAVAHVILESA